MSTTALFIFGYHALSSGTGTNVSKINNGTFPIAVS